METHSLNGSWKLIALQVEKNPTVKNEDEFTFELPGEIHQALIENEKIENPYLGCKLNSTKWVEKSKWKVSKDFALEKKDGFKAILKLTRVKAKASIYINGVDIGYAENEYKSHFYDITEEVVDGNNEIEIELEELKHSANLPINPIGIFNDISIILTKDFFIRDYSIVPIKVGSSWRVDTNIEIEAFSDYSIVCKTEFKDEIREEKLNLKNGIGIYTSSFTLNEDSVDLWWPNGYGKQHLYPISIAIGDFKRDRFIAFRTVDVKKSKNLALVINGKSIFMKGTNWEGTRPLPNGQFSHYEARLLEAIASANMNMLRVPKEVGYERDRFYSECDRLGIAIWQALPDRIEEEEYTLLRIKSHPSIVLWSAEGKDAERLERRERELDPTRPFYIEREENHSWPNWLNGEDFNAYHKKSPDFISQFGVPSYPYQKTLAIITGENNVNLTSKEMTYHQQNKRDIEEIFGLIARNFDFPLSRKKLVYLSQAQQALAITDGVMGWRALMPYTMGTLFSTLNDIWPRISNSAIDYQGRFKPLLYASKRFFSSLTPLLYIENDKLLVYVSNDSFNDEEVELKLKLRYFNGKKKESHVYNVKVPSMTSIKVKEIDLRKLDRNNLFAYAKMQNKSILRERTILLDKPKLLNLENPEIKTEITKLSPRKVSIKLSSAKPAFLVTLDSGSIDGIFSDNFIAIRQTAEKNIIFDSTEELDIEELKKELIVMDLYNAMH